MADWYFDEHGYIRGGNDTPIFVETKKEFNLNVTLRNREEQLNTQATHDGSVFHGSSGYFDNLLLSKKVFSQGMGSHLLPEL